MHVYFPFIFLSTLTTTCTHFFPDLAPNTKVAPLMQGSNLSTFSLYFCMHFTSIPIPKILLHDLSTHYTHKTFPLKSIANTPEKTIKSLSNGTVPAFYPLHFFSSIFFLSSNNEPNSLGFSRSFPCLFFFRVAQHFSGSPPRSHAMSLF